MSKENEKLKNYILLKTIGKGTFGKVKLAKHIPTDEEVAIKILEKSKINDDDELIRINKEIKYLKLLNHPNIVHLYEIVETQNNYYIIMEYISGGELFNYIVKNKRLSEFEASNFFSQIINAVEEIHKNKICHRDLKPENILLSSDNKILKIIDFGLSNEYVDYLTTPCGSPCYAAPEMVRGKKYNGLYIDIWACGIILFAMVYGYLPFDDKDNEKLFHKILKCNLTFPPNEKIFISNECKDLIKKIIRVNPKERISLDDIKKHPFITRNNNISNINLSFDEYLINDKMIIEYMENNLNINNSGNIIQKYIKKNKHNNITTTFKLLKKKFIEGRGNLRQNSIESKERKSIKINEKRNLRNSENIAIKNQMNITSTRIDTNDSLKDLNLSKKEEKDNLIIINNNKLIPSKVKINPIYNKLIPINEENKKKRNNKKIDTSVSIDKKRDKSKTNSPVNKKSTKSTISTQISNNTNKESNIGNDQKINIRSKNNKNGNVNVIAVKLYNKNKIVNKIDKRVISADSGKHKKKEVSPIRLKTPTKIQKKNVNNVSPIRIQRTPIKNIRDLNYKDKVIKTEGNNNETLNSNRNKINNLNITSNSKNHGENNDNKKHNKINTFTLNNQNNQVRTNKNKLSPYNYRKINNNNNTINNDYPKKNIVHYGYFPISQREKKQNNKIILNKRELDIIKKEKMIENSGRNLTKNSLNNLFINNKPTKTISTQNSFEKINEMLIYFCNENNLNKFDIESNKYIIEIENENKLGFELTEENGMNFMKFYHLEGDKNKTKYWIKKIMNKDFDL